MTEQEIFEKLQKIISSVLKITPIDSVKIDSDLVRNFSVDTLDVLHILSRAEREFGLSLGQNLYSISNDFFQKPTVKNCVDIISSALTESKQQTNTVTTNNYTTPTYKSTAHYGIKYIMHVIKTKWYCGLVKKEHIQR